MSTPIQIGLENENDWRSTTRIVLLMSSMAARRFLMGHRWCGCELDHIEHIHKLVNNKSQEG